MAPIKSISLQLFATAAACGTGAAVAYNQIPDADTRNLTIIIAVGCTLGLGLICFLASFAGYASQRRQAGRLIQYTRSVLETGKGSAPRLDPPWHAAAKALDQAARVTSQRIEDLQTRLRQFEIESRVSDAERRNLEAILNAISDGVIVTDAFHEVMIANGSAARALRFELEDALQRPVDEVITDARLTKLIKDTTQATHHLRRSLEHHLKDSDGEAFYQITSSRIINDASPAGVVTVLHNITRDKEIAEMKSDFVSKVSHELRTPLSSIKAYIEMLIDGEAHDEETRAEFYNIVQSETNRLQRLIDNILSISRIESGVTKVHRELVTLPKLVKECIDVLQPQAQAKNITLIEIAAPVFFDVHADRDMIYQATMNLMSNAIKYTQQGGQVKIAIEVDEHDRQAIVSVTDNGAGIPAEDLPMLFQKFFRVQSNNKLATGTGLGLNLVKHVIESVHNGRVWVESEVGKGSTFRYALPIADNT